MKMIKKIGVFISVYSLFLIIFFAPLILIPDSVPATNMSGNLFLIYIFIIIPAISLLIPRYLIRKFNFNKYFIWILNIIFVYLFSVLFFLFTIAEAFNNFSVVGF